MDYDITFTVEEQTQTADSRYCDRLLWFYVLLSWATIRGDHCKKLRTSNDRIHLLSLSKETNQRFPLLVQLSIGESFGFFFSGLVLIALWQQQLLFDNKETLKFSLVFLRAHLVMDVTSNVVDLVQILLLKTRCTFSLFPDFEISNSLEFGAISNFVLLIKFSVEKSLN